MAVAKKADSAPKVASTNVHVKPLSLGRILVEIEGLTELVMHNWDEKVKEEMLAKQMGKAYKGRKKRDPEAEYEASKYKTADGKLGFPARAIKASMVDATSLLDKSVTKVGIRQMLFVVGDILPVKGTPRMRQDMVRVGMGTADLRFRASVFPWSIRIPFEYNTDAITPEQIVNLLNLAGFGVGIGEDRPQKKNGSWGRFRVKSER